MTASTIGTRLDISAESSVARKPDLVTIGAGVTSDGPTATAAMRANADRMAAVLAALKRAGIADRDIQTASITLVPQYRYEENRPPILSGYQASNQLSIRFREIDRAGAILDALVAQGVNQIDGPAFSIEKADSALDQARAEAVAKARARAEIYARAAGLRVKRIISISEAEGTAPPPRPMVMMASAKMADTAVMAGEQALTISVAVSFELE